MDSNMVGERSDVPIAIIGKDAVVLKSFVSGSGDGQTKHHNEVNNNAVQDVFTARSSDGNEVRRDVDEDEEVERLRCCCLSGCLSSLTLALMFFVALPAGTLLCVYASSHSDDQLLAVGIVLSLLPILALPVLVVALYNRRKLKRLASRGLKTKR